MVTESLNSAGGGKLTVSVWVPSGTPVGVVQLVHGICEHAGRYDDFARWLNERGYLVAAEDHMGHGASVSKAHPLGCIKGGWDAMTADVHTLTARLRQRYPAQPLFLLGHSMGSFLARTCLYTHPDAGYSGCILSGTAWHPAPVLQVAQTLTKGEMHRHGEHTPSPSLKNLVFGAYTKGFRDVKSPNDWVSSVRAAVDSYDADPLCGFVPSGGMIYAMLDGLSRNQQADNLSAMRKDLPVFLIAGDRDPVANRGKAVRQTRNAFRKAGLTDVETKLYPGARHDVLEEYCKDEVWADVLKWMEARIAP